MTLSQMSIQAGLLIAVTLLLRPLCRRMLPKETMLMMWAVVLGRMLIPFSLLSKWSVYPVIRGTLSHGDVPGEQWIQSMEESKITTVWWMVGCFFLAVFALGFVFHYRRISHGIPVEENEAILRWQENHRHFRQIEVLCSNKIKTPVTVGFFRPRILLPSCMDMKDVQLMEHILTHEYCHVVRMDILWKSLTLLAICVHWFNPFSWIMLKYLNRDLEITCDEWVLRQCGMDKEGKRNYAQSLIRMAEHKEGCFPMESRFSRHPLEERIRFIMTARKHNISVILVSFALVLGCTLCFATTAKANTAHDPVLSPFPMEQVTANRSEISPENETEIPDEKVKRTLEAVLDQKFRSEEHRREMLEYFFKTKEKSLKE